MGLIEMHKQHGHAEQDHITISQSYLQIQG